MKEMLFFLHYGVRGLLLYVAGITTEIRGVGKKGSGVPGFTIYRVSHLVPDTTFSLIPR